MHPSERTWSSRMGSVLLVPRDQWTDMFFVFCDYSKALGKQIFTIFFFGKARLLIFLFMQRGTVRDDATVVLCRKGAILRLTTSKAIPAAVLHGRRHYTRQSGPRASLKWAKRLASPMFVIAVITSAVVPPALVARAWRLGEVSTWGLPSNDPPAFALGSFVGSHLIPKM